MVAASCGRRAVAEIYERVTERTLSALPEDNINSHLFRVTVAYRGADRWAVLHHGFCLNREGDWDYESIPSERTDEWLAEHRFSEDEAVRLAREAMPRLTVNGLTVDDVLARTGGR
jgi:hypothetical protein